MARAFPPDGRPWPDLEQVHAWLRACRLDFVPAPIPRRDGLTLTERAGRLWELSPWKPGAPEPGPSPRPARLRAALEALATFHRSIARHRSLGPSPGLAARLREIESLRADGFDRLAAALASAPSDPHRDLARRWLDLARRLAPNVAADLRVASSRVVPLQPCLRDARPDHVLFTEDRVTGLVDFGAMGVDSVAADLSRLLTEWLGPASPLRADALSAYGSLDSSEADLIAAFDRSSALLGGGRWVRWHYLEGRRFDDPSSVLLGLRRRVERIEWLAGA